MTRRNPPAKWILPRTVDPPTRTSWCVPVPDDPFHRAAFLGALLDLCSAYKWQDDNAHTAKQVAKVWQQIYDELKKCEVNVPAVMGTDGDGENLIRQNPDNPCLLETSINGTDWCVFADLSKCAPPLNQPSGTQPQPKPGGCQKYHGVITNGARWLIPTTLSTGDTIELSNVNGASNINSAIQWYCPDGQLYFAGSCVGSVTTDPTNVVPSAPTASVVLYLNATYYALTGVFTVPSGITTQNGVLVINAPLSDVVNGNVEFDVNVCSGAIATWSHTFDFLTSPHGWTPLSGYHDWVAGVGFPQRTDCTSFDNVIIFSPTVASTTFTGMDITIAASTSSGPPIAAYANHDESILVDTSTSVLSTYHLTGALTDVAVCALYDPHTGVSVCDSGAIITSVTVHGNGSDPFTAF